MPLYMKIIDGETVVKEAAHIVIVNGNMQTISPTHKMLVADGWEEYVSTPSIEHVEPVETIGLAKKVATEEIIKYDSSQEVNQFYIHGMRMWIDKATRVGLMLRFNAEIGFGKTETTLWYEGMGFPMKLTDAVSMLYAVELYASACYDKTQEHIANVSKLETIAEVKAYDYTVGYPEPLRFDTNEVML